MLDPSSPRSARSLVVTVFLSCLGAATAYAQGKASPDLECTDPRQTLGSTAFDACTSPSPDTTHASLQANGAPMTRQQRSLTRAVAGLTVVNLMAVGINNLARDLPSTRPETWWRNLQGGWNWDDNNISTNNIEHPYGGAVYFNIGRANGFSFWGSAPITLGGSLMWELFGEPTPPARNDLLTTTLGGISFGESVLRMSNLILDNQAHGLDRVWREAAVVLLNPGLGLTRLARGEAWHTAANPGSWRPDTVSTTLAVGRRMQTLPTSAPDAHLDLGYFGFALEYGDPFRPTRVEPFSNFTFTTQLTAGGSVVVTEVGTRGMLAAFGRRTDRVNGVFMDLEFQWNDAYIFGQQSFGVGTLARTGGAEGWRLTSEASGELAPLVASSDPYAGIVKREYDYGVGVGARAGLKLEHAGFRVLEARYRTYWTRTVNGASDTKLDQFAAVTARAPIMGGLSAGASYALYTQRSTYDARPNAWQTLPSWSVFVSTGR